MLNISQCIFLFFLIYLTCLQINMLNMHREGKETYCNNMTQDFECFYATCF